jgi:pteridine reductase
MTVQEPGPGRLAVIGATSRVGRAVAEIFLERGWSLELTARDPDRIDPVIRPSCESATPRARCHALDLADADAVDRVTESIGSAPLDAVVVAGAPFEEMPLAEATADDFHYHAAAQLAGPARLVERLRPALAAATSPAVALFGDIHARSRPRANATPYLVAKAGVEAMVGLLAVELAPIRVFGLSPGVVGWPEDWPETRRHAYLERVPLGRAGTPEEAALLVRSLLLDATYCTGIVIPIDGGRHLR